MTSGILLCTDLDRTLLPNGEAPESPGVRKLFGRFCQQAGITLAYVSGRHPELVDEAVKTYAIPEPDYLITDVGTRIFSRRPSGYQLLEEWQTRIEADWDGFDMEAIARFLGPAPGLRRQEKERENPCKLSYYVDLAKNSAALAETFSARLESRGLAANVVWSIDPLLDLGLLDILPQAANKLKAIEFLLQERRQSPVDMLFAGDSGNDLDVFLSPLNAVVVANAGDDIKNHAAQAVGKRGQAHSLYIAKGDFWGLNGNYAAGILEGTAHFFPRLTKTLQHLIDEMNSDD